MLETLDINRYKIITYIYVCVIYTENLAAQSLYLHQFEPRFPAGELLLRQILEFSCVPSPTLLSPSAEEQDVSLQPSSPGVSLELQEGFGYHTICGSASSATGQEQREQDVVT